MKISGIVLSFNEQDKIQKCLQALKFTDEIILIDNGSKDQTVSIAKKNKARIFTEKSNDFSRLRSLGARQSRFDWLLYIDADEIVTEKLAAEIKKATTLKFSSYYLTRQNFYFNTSWPYQEKMIRLIKKDALIGWRGQIHETAIVKHAHGFLKNPLLHYTHDSLTRMVEKTNRWSATEASLRIKANHPPVFSWRFFRVMATSFWRVFIKQKGYRAGTVGLIESIYQSFSIFITYAKLWELQNKKRKS